MGWLQNAFPSLYLFLTHQYPWVLEGLTVRKAHVSGYPMTGWFCYGLGLILKVLRVWSLTQQGQHYLSTGQTLIVKSVPKTFSLGS